MVQLNLPAAGGAALRTTGRSEFFQRAIKIQAGSELDYTSAESKDLHMFMSRIALRRSVVGILQGVALLCFASVVGRAWVPADGTQQTNPWSMSQVIQPADLAKELGQPPRPEIVCVGFGDLYRGAHISGAAYHGPASKPEGLEDLRKWARGIPHCQQIVVYCGCCPMDRCPNVRPAFQALKEMGFTNLRVLSIPQDLGKDWVQKGLPVEKGR